MKFEPLSDRVIVIPEDPVDRSKGGILIPDNAKERPMRGKVLSVGPGRIDDNGYIVKMSVAVGDTVLYPSFAGNEIEHKGDKLLVIRETDILARVIG